jgi:hypothetical protein
MTNSLTSRSPAAPPVPAAALGPRDRLNEGANGVIYSLPSFTLGDEPGQLVLKEYRSVAAPVSSAGLQGIVDARLRLAAHRRRALDELTVWPLRVVVGDTGDPQGVLMRLIPDTFMARMTLPSGRQEIGPREVQHLIFDPAAARRLGVCVPDDRDVEGRLRICERLCYVISILHGANLVYGDLSARNLLYRLAPQPSVLLVDCDAARVRGSAPANKQLDTPDWNPPEIGRGGGVQSQSSDRYKLALFVLRCLTPGRRSSVNRDWSVAVRVLPGGGLDLLKRALDGRPEDRPLAREWLFYLRTRLGDRPVPPPAGAPDAGASRNPVRQTHNGWKRGHDGTWHPA